MLVALEAVFGTSGPASEWDFAGKTDPQIIWELMLAAGIMPEAIEAAYDRAIANYLELLDRALRPERISLKPGVRELLTTLGRRRDVVVGILTGNVAAGAELKLDRAGIRDHFVVGAYGSDRDRRDQLPQIAVQRALDLTGYPFKGKEIVIIGDTPNDVACGRDLGVKAIAVATGNVAMAQLEGNGPDFCFLDLSHTRAVVEAILA